MVSATSDELDIRNVLARLAHRTDHGALEEYLALFTDDATIELPGQEPRRGRAALESSAQQSRDAGRLGPGSNCRHVVATIEVNVVGDEAASRACFLFVTEASSAPTVQSVGHYDDVLRRTPTGWRVAQRTISFG